jgi:hypothetical protein
MEGNSDDWRILSNYLGGSVTLTGVRTTVLNNFGYNPVGSISNPWPLVGTDLSNNVESGKPIPRSGITYTVRQTPKTIVISGGDVSRIHINGADGGSRAGTFKLGIGETIAIDYGTTAPTTAIWAE